MSYCFPKYPTLVDRCDLAFCAFAIIGVVGCGNTESTRLSGSIHVDGERLRSGIVCIFASNHQTFSATVNDGEFEVRGVPPGDIRITVASQPVVTNFQYTTPDFVPTTKSRGEFDRGGSVEPQFNTQALSEKYGRVDTSPLRFHVQAGRQHIMLALEE